MNYNNYNLRQLLELALRVPEVGAVNFNILYYILKTIIQKQGLESVKPVFTFDPSFAAESGAKEQVKKASLRRSYSAESLKSATEDQFKIRRKSGSDENISQTKPSRDVEKESTKWNKIKFFKRLDAVEEEISDLHIMIAQLVDKVSNFERTVGLRETKFLKEMANLESKGIEEASKLQKIAANVTKFKSMLKGEEYSESSEESDDEGDEDDKTDSGKKKKAKIAKETVGLEMTESSEEAEKIDVKSKKRLHRKKKDSELMSEIEHLASEINVIKDHLKVLPYEKISLKTQPDDTVIVRTRKDEDSQEEETEPLTKKDIGKIELELLNVSAELRKLKDRGLDKLFASDIGVIKDKNLTLEKTLSEYVAEIDAIKISWDEMIHGFENIKENMQYIEKQMTLLTEFPGLVNRVEQLEGYVYSGHDYEYELKRDEDLILPKRPVLPEIDATDKFISKAKKITKSIPIPEIKTDIPPPGIFKPSIKKAEKTKARDIEEELEEEEGLYYGSARRRFQAVARNIALIQDMEKKKFTPKYKTRESYKEYEDEDDYLYDEPMYHKPPKSPAEEFGEALSTEEVASEYSEAKIKSSTFSSPDALEEHSRQLKGQVIVFVKQRLKAFEVDLQHIEGDLVTLRKKNDDLDNNFKELAEKLAFTDANFSQRAGDLAALKDMAENHHISIVNIMHHLDRKAEAYAVNQKVSRKELTVIEDRVQKLCIATSSEITKLEEKLVESMGNFNLELDKKLFSEEFEVHLESLLHKMRVLEAKFKQVSVQTPVLDFERIRPLEIKKYVLSKDGTKIKQGRKKIVPCQHNSTSDSIIPILAQHHPDKEASPKTAIQIQKELEKASYRESRCYVGGAYTKITTGQR